ncbi:uncharacterized protein BCR38DRAFT_450446 [Pseudomassariella vexata]|uniref:F-box domain-containing protein n=1 Tax=Pseudomassariella vexata TaxID=1141098 RepID=A0A1Y2DCH5_9PEZI|nr:uncharacterized protein BCR38DRAFT_450446 [Pseudomassariella vexata]ORY56961.1 hypothetical protein BCR38DRAFT_450446 [Pseudomassariella vexata]
MPSFQDLPFDIHCEVSKHLDYPSALALKKCNCYFYCHIDPNRLSPGQKQDFLSKAELFTQNKSLYICYRCSHLLPKSSFGHKQITGPRSKNASHPTHDRFCWNCAAKYRLCEHALAYRKGKKLFYLCWKCQRWGPKYERCGIPNDPTDRDFRNPGWRCCPVEPSPTLQGLPSNIRQIMLEMLGYRDSIALSQTSRLFHAVVDPSQCALHDKFRFVRDMVLRINLGNQDQQQQRSAYYACFCILPDVRFTTRQLDMARENPSRGWKRRCRSCVWRLYGDSDNTGPLKEWRARRMCRGCKLMMRKGERCLGCWEKVGEQRRLEVQEQRELMGDLEELGGLGEVGAGGELLFAAAGLDRLEL